MCKWIMEIILVTKTTVYGALFTSIQIEKNTMQIQFQKSVPKIKGSNILVIYNMLEPLYFKFF